MGSLSEATFTARVELGCTKCGSKKLTIRAYVAGKFPLMEGEPVAPVVWAYKGETFVDGVFAITCSSCRHILFEDPACPQCHDPGGLERALETENQHVVLKACPGCGQVMTTYRALVPAVVAYEGRRAQKARTSVGLYDPGFHGLGADCKACGSFAPHDDESGCALCTASAGPRRNAPAAV
jgi:RNA polymerase subunit RPABC4/transcription elongation factor Spt4